MTCDKIWWIKNIAFLPKSTALEDFVVATIKWREKAMKTRNQGINSLKSSCQGKNIACGLLTHMTDW